MYRFLRKVAVEQYRIADVIAVQSPSNLEHFARGFVKEKFSVQVLFNWTVLHEAELPRTNYREQLGLENKTVFLYGGNLGVAQDIDNALRLAARLASRTDIYFLLVGDGSEVARLQVSVVNQGLENIRIVAALEQRDYLATVSEFDVGLISLDARLNSHNVPGKLLSYLYWGIPVLASVNRGNDLFGLLSESAAGFCVVHGERPRAGAGRGEIGRSRWTKSQHGQKCAIVVRGNFFRGARGRSDFPSPAASEIIGAQERVVAGGIREQSDAQAKAVRRSLNRHLLCNVVCA